MGSQIENYIKHVLKIKNVKVVAKDLLKYEAPMENNSVIVVNLDNHDGPGTHWTVIVRKDDKIYYFDPFGLPMGETVETFVELTSKKFNLQILRNTTQVQKITSNKCGYHVIDFVRALFS